MRSPRRPLTPIDHALSRRQHLHPLPHRRRSRQVQGLRLSLQSHKTYTIADAAVARLQRAYRAQQGHAPERLVAGREGLLFPFMTLTGRRDRLVFTACALAMGVSTCPLEVRLGPIPYMLSCFLMPKRGTLNLEPFIDEALARFARERTHHPDDDTQTFRLRLFFGALAGFVAQQQAS